jgi:ferrous iron transport protein B
MTFGTLYSFGGELSENGSEIWAQAAADFGPVRAYSFMSFQLLCAPCFAAIGAIRREMCSVRWTAGTVAYMCGFAYLISLIVYQLGGLLTGEASFGVFTVLAVVALIALLWLVLRRGSGDRENRLSNVKATKV